MVIKKKQRNGTSWTYVLNVVDNTVLFHDLRLPNMVYGIDHQRHFGACAWRCGTRNRSIRWVPRPMPRICKVALKSLWDGSNVTHILPEWFRLVMPSEGIAQSDWQSPIFVHDMLCPVRIPLLHNIPKSTPFYFWVSSQLKFDVRKSLDQSVNFMNTNSFWRKNYYKCYSSGELNLGKLVKEETQIVQT